MTGNKQLGVKTVILFSGLELIADVEEFITGDGVSRLTLKKPFKIETAYIPQQTERGVGIAGIPQLVQFASSAIENTLVLNSREQVWSIKDTNKAVHDAYFRQTTGLQLAMG